MKNKFFSSLFFLQTKRSEFSPWVDVHDTRMSNFNKKKTWLDVHVSSDVTKLHSNTDNVKTITQAETNRRLHSNFAFISLSHFQRGVFTTMKGSSIYHCSGLNETLFGIQLDFRRLLRFETQFLKVKLSFVFKIQLKIKQKNCKLWQKPFSKL